MSNVIQDKAVEGMMGGVSIATSLIRPTYGGFGSNVVVEAKLYPYHGIYNDAQSIVQAIEVKDPAQKIGLDFVKELCDRAEKTSGDARKTTLILLEEILKGGYASPINKLQLKRDLDKLIPTIEAEIDKRTKKITVDDVNAVATTASENEETGQLLQDIYKEIGATGFLFIEGSKTYETSYKIINGVKFEGTGMLSPEMVHDEEAIADKRKETRAVYENPLILVTKKKITTDYDINPLLVEMRNLEKRDLVIFTQDMDSEVAAMLINLHKSKQFNILIIKAPILWQGYVFEDFAKCVGATVVEDATGVSFKTLTLKHLGTCGRIEVDSEDTTLTGISDISEHIKQLVAKGDDDSLQRLLWLNTKSAVLKLGANSQTDLSYKRLKAHDANRSTYAALQHGVVAGGGYCLWDVALAILGDSEAEKIMKIALRAPLEQAKKNYNLSHEEYVKLLSENIVDASMVVKKAVRNAIGIASTILTASAIVHLPILTPEEMAYQIAMKQSNPFGQ